MSVVSIPVTRPAGRVLIVANAALQPQPMGMMNQLGFDCALAADPYAALAELCARGAHFRALVLSLQSLYREELSIIATVKRRFPHMEIWLTHTDGRQPALAEAIRLGADGLLSEDGLDRVAPTPGLESYSAPRAVEDFAPQEPGPTPAPEAPSSSHPEDEAGMSEPVLTADELRALLQEQPSMPPSAGNEN